MIVAAAVLLPGLALLAAGIGRRARLVPGGLSRPLVAGWTLVALSLAAAIAVDGRFGLIAWIGLLPVLGAAVTLTVTYRLGRPATLAVAAALVCVVAILA